MCHLCYTFSNVLWPCLHFLVRQIRPSNLKPNPLLDSKYRVNTCTNISNGRADSYYLHLFCSFYSFLLSRSFPWWTPSLVSHVTPIWYRIHALMDLLDSDHHVHEIVDPGNMTPFPHIFKGFSEGTHLSPTKDRNLLINRCILRHRLMQSLAKTW